MSHYMHWVWLSLLGLVIAAQFWGMKVGHPLSRRVQRITTRYAWASILIGAATFWLPVHWYFSRATTVAVWDWVAIFVGGTVGYAVHLKRRNDHG